MVTVLVYYVALPHTDLNVFLIKDFNYSCFLHIVITLRSFISHLFADFGQMKAQLIISKLNLFLLDYFNSTFSQRYSLKN